MIRNLQMESNDMTKWNSNISNGSVNNPMWLGEKLTTQNKCFVSNDNYGLEKYVTVDLVERENVDYPWFITQIRIVLKRGRTITRFNRSQNSYDSCKILIDSQQINLMFYDSCDTMEFGDFASCCTDIENEEMRCDLSKPT